MQVVANAKESAALLGLSEAETQKVIKRLEPVSHDAVMFDRINGGKGGEREFTYRDGTGWEQTCEVFDPHRQAVKRSPKGQKGITNYGGKMVRNACNILQRHYGRGRLCFATLTLDSSNPNWQWLCCDGWAEIVRKFIQELQRELERVGAPIHIVGVTEIQTKRSDKEGYIIPHLHIVFVSWDGKSKVKKGFSGDEKWERKWYIPHKRAKEIFDRVCVNEIARATEIPANEIKVNNRVNLQAVKKSAEGYLGKYMSKGAKDVKKYLEAVPNRDDIPSHWWHCTKELRQAVKSLIKPVPPALVDAILDNPGYLISEKVIQYCREITKEINGVKRIIGYAFRLHKDYVSIGREDLERAFNST